MIYSMTGYGKAEGSFRDVPYEVEIKTLNSKYTDFNLKLPQELRSYEIPLRKRLEQALQRGKIHLQIQPRASVKTDFRLLNREVLQNYVREVTEIYPEAGRSEIIASLLRHPDVWILPASDEGEALYHALTPAIEKAVEEVNAFRLHEGLRIEADMGRHLDEIGKALDEIVRLAPTRKEKLRAHLTGALEEAGIRPDPERFEQELIYYLEKWDINEEIQRLHTHLRHFDETLKDESKRPKGKKLNFIAQEMGREINTMGAKANDAAIQRLVVSMKDALEKIKEQTANVL